MAIELQRFRMKSKYLANYFNFPAYLFIFEGENEYQASFFIDQVVNAHETASVSIKK